MPRVIGGKLKLKGIKSSILPNKKKIHSKVNNTDKKIDDIMKAVKEVKEKEEEEVQGKEDSDDDYDEMLTKSERQHKEILKKKTLESISKSDDLSYRNRLNKFNEKLANSTEHNYIPRVSAAGNG